MLIPSHLVLSLMIYHKTCWENGAKLNFLGFYLGSIQPDIDKRINKRKHSFDESIDYVENLWQDISSHTEDSYSFNYSRKLGIITHYMADYFCLPHNNHPLKDNITKHLWYEYQLHRSLIKVKKIFAQKEKPVVLKDFLQAQRGEYFNQSPGLNNDVTFITENCCSLVLAATSPAVQLQPIVAY